GFKLEKGARDIQEFPQTPSTIHFGPGGTKFGDWEPGFSHLEQRTWTGGRGLDDFSLDVTRFYDSLNAFTMLEDKCFSAMQWRFATGLRVTHENLPGDVNWQALTGNERYVSATFTVGSSSMAADNLEFWIRRIGSPGTLTAEIWTNSGGDPNAVVASATKTVTVTEITDWVSLFHTFDLSAASDLSSTTKYHAVLYGASTDNAANHWEVGVDSSESAGSGSRDSSDGETWGTAPFALYYRLSDADINRKWHFFNYKGQLYAVDQRAGGGNSGVFMNGERGRVTSASSTTLRDTNMGEDGSWVSSQWNGWWVQIVRGTGSGQRRKITGNSTGGTITVKESWDETPDTTSDYVVYGGDAWQELTMSNNDISGVVSDVDVFGGIVVMARGENQVAYFMRYSNGGHAGDNAPTDDKTKVDLVKSGYDTVDGSIVWLGRNADVTVAKMKTFTWLSPAVGDIGDAINVGSDAWLMTNMKNHAGKLHIFKESGLYIINNDRARKRNIGLGFIKSGNNGEMMIVHDTDLYFSWGGFSVQRLIGGSLASIGPDKGTGLPSGRESKAVSAKSHPAGMFVCMNGRRGKTSSVLFYNNDRLGWHEIFRAWGSGKQVQKIAWQDNPGTKPRLWISVNGDIVYQEWPTRALNPLENAGVNYQHEFYITLADMDMGVARLPKFFKEVTLLTENLATGIEAYVEYQLDKDIGGTEWIQAGTIHLSPEQSVDIRRGNARRIRIRIRMLTNDASTPPILTATVLEAFARTPLKYQWNMRVKIASNQKTKRSTPDHKPDDILTWLKNAAKQAEVLHMRSRWKQMDDIYVIVEPPSLMRSFANAIRKTWKGSVVFTVREA
ncbi:hypothetical protein LCGC14_1625790, partial [marine sediment metagenome]